MASREANTCPPGSALSPHQGNHSDTSTPSKGEGTPKSTRRNKRKMSEPRKRREAPAKRICLEDGAADIFDDDEDDDVMLGMRRLLDVTPDQSPSSDERNNSTGSGPSPESTPRPTSISHFIPGLSMAGIFPTPILTNIAGIPRYAFMPGLIPGFPTAGFPGSSFIPPHSLMTPNGLRLPTGASTITTSSTVTTPHSQPQQKHKSPEMDNNHNCVMRLGDKGPSPSGSQCSAPSPSPSVSSVQDDSHSHGNRKQRKNYKNMTRERRVEANARERTRVHTISAAFESLRRAVPSYSYHQRLSKLAILRIACSYILALSRLTEHEYEEEKDRISFSECVDLCTQTIQSEGRAKRRH